MKLTGKALSDLALVVASKEEATTWEEMDDKMRCDVTRLASLITRDYITPLQQLALDWERLAEDHETIVAGEYTAFEHRWTELRQRTKNLVGEEHSDAQS